MLSLCGDSEIDIYRDGQQLLFKAGNVIIHGWEMDLLSEFPVEAISNYLNQDFHLCAKLTVSPLWRRWTGLLYLLVPMIGMGLFNVTDRG